MLARELGAGPLALARAHRAHTARSLLVDTDLALADVAFASGFSSIRQFNETIQMIHHTTPSSLRAAGPRRTARAAASVGSASESFGAIASHPPTSITLRLPVRAPFDGRGMMQFLADHAVVGLESVEGDSFARSVRLPGGSARIKLSLEPVSDPAAPTAAVLCTATLDNIADLSPLVTRVRRFLDLDADSQAIDDALSQDPALAPSVAAHPGVRLPGSLDANEVFFRTMMGQQVSVAAARTVIGRISAELSATPGLFPTPTEIAEHGEGVIRGPARRVSSILFAARAIANGDLALDVGMPRDEFISRLLALPGVGPWTAGYVAMRVLGHPDILLSSDLVMLSSAGALGLPSTARELAAHGRRWAPWRSYAGLHLWLSR